MSRHVAHSPSLGKSSVYRADIYRLASMLIFAIVTLTACGQKGDLYLPPASSPQPEATTPENTGTTDNTTQEETESN